MLAALIVGGLTAWYLGLRAGVIAAVATAGALVVAAFVPGLTMVVYALVLAWSGALYFLGAKLSANTKRPPITAAGATTVIAGIASQAQSWFKKLSGSDKSK